MIAPAIWIICGLGIMTVLYLSSNLVVPIVTALLAYLALRPSVARLCSKGVPKPLASGLVMLVLFFVISFALGMLLQSARYWISQAPKTASQLQGRLETIRQPLVVLDRVQGKLSELSEETDGKSDTLTVDTEKPDLVDETVLVNSTGKLIAFLGGIAVLTFFMLATGDDLLNRVLYVMPDEQQRHEMLELTSHIQDAIGRYLGQITLINVGLGVVVTIVMWLIGMPTPLLWGTMATLFNYIPYVGALAATGLVALAALAAFGNFWSAFFTAVLFWSLTAVEGQFITPSVLGRTLRVGPVIVLVAVAFWGFLWGIPGIFLAVPMLIVMRQIFGQFHSTRPLAVVLGEEPGGRAEPPHRVEDDKPISAVA